jgi:hypothetical protein
MWSSRDTLERIAIRGHPQSPRLLPAPTQAGRANIQ